MMVDVVRAQLPENSVPAGYYLFRAILRMHNMLL